MADRSIRRVESLVQAALSGLADCPAVHDASACDILSAVLTLSLRTVEACVTLSPDEEAALRDAVVRLSAVTYAREMRKLHQPTVH